VRLREREEVQEVLWIADDTAPRHRGGDSRARRTGGGIGAAQHPGPSWPADVLGRAACLRERQGPARGGQRRRGSAGTLSGGLHPAASRFLTSTGPIVLVRERNRRRFAPRDCAARLHPTDRRPTRCDHAASAHAEWVLRIPRIAQQKGLPRENSDRPNSRREPEGC
jgi:hypothetical protein